MYQVYILKLEYDKYFIGHTQSIENFKSQLKKKNIEIGVWWAIKETLYLPHKYNIYLN